jgi:hypothetical protein
MTDLLRRRRWRKEEEMEIHGSTAWHSEVRTR